MVPLDGFSDNGERMYAMADWQVWPERSLLRRDTHEQHVEPKVMAVLCCLLREEGRVVGRDALLDAVWSDVVVNEEVLTRAVSELRTLLGDTGRPRRYIGTVPRKGYRLLVPVQQLPATADFEWAPSIPATTPVTTPATIHATVHATTPPYSTREPARRAPIASLGLWLHRAISTIGYFMVLILLLSFWLS